MTTQAGLWIDHRKAVVVVVSEAGDATRLIESNVEKHVHYSGGARPSGSHDSRPAVLLLESRHPARPARL